MSGHSRTLPAAVAALVVGAAVLFLADAEALRVASAALLLAGIGLGVLAVATPEFLTRDQEED